MLPLNYAILKFIEEGAEGDATAIMECLRHTYDRFRTFHKKAVIEALMTAEANGLLEETRYELDSGGCLAQYYKATDSGIAMIRKYIR
jgi:DNA-binding PadR family transcriptional regulator